MDEQPKTDPMTAPEGANLDKSRMERVIIPLIRNIGFIGSIILSFAYIGVITVLVIGFESRVEFLNGLTFALVSAAMGILISQLLKLQGITWAKEIPENKKVLEQYNGAKIKDRVFKPISTYWWKSVLKDIAFKGITVAASCGGVIYIAIEGSGNYGLLILGIVNLLLFISLGLFSLAMAYEFYNNQHINYLRQQMQAAKEVNHDTNTTTKRAKNGARKTSAAKRTKHIDG